MKGIKKMVAGVLVASALINSPPVLWTAANAKVYAASQVTKSTTSNYPINVNGLMTTIHTIQTNGRILVSAKELAQHFSATYTYNKKQKKHYISRKSPKLEMILMQNSETIIVNGKKKTLSIPSKLVKNELYVDATRMSELLGGQLLIDQQVMILSTKGQAETNKSLLTFDGTQKSIRTLSFDKTTLYSIHDLASAFGASVSFNKKNKMITIYEKNKQILLNPFSNTLNVNGKKSKMPSTPVVIKDVPYADLTSIVNALGGDIEGRFIATAGFLKGSNTTPQWVSPSLILVKNEDNSVLKLINIHSRKVVATIPQSDAVVSPDGKYAAYVDDNGLLYTIDLMNGKTKQISDDDDVKVDLIWSKDSKRLYFIQGSNNDVISVVSVDSGVITKLVDDKVKYKSDLLLSPDGTTILYTAAKEAKTTYTDNQNTDVDSIDTAGTDPQLFIVDLTSNNKQPVQLTNSADNKVDSNFVSNNQVIYLSATNDKTSFPSLKMLKGGQEETLLANKNIIDITVSDGTIYVVIEEANGTYTIHSLNPETKKLTQLASTKEMITSLSVSPYNKQIAVTMLSQTGEKVAILENGQFVDITK
ncbi:stalk domain-containing protein [Anoxybacillus sp. J5B_2022]|uniref:stalk domain-containing protein n=1 Tax=Anoxybacillus sp. J5B_2022 TaxID=3003246 RepID=UPI0022858138|nr:stalk domain-containing protein [Anoxybacillus sp. J5B_2022]MCZ0756365.1 stalk domain-containing protein [Anoxybacillus sp. J5B_2022]